MNATYTKDGVPIIKTAFDTASYQPHGWTSGYFINKSHEKIFYSRTPAEGPVQGTVVLTTGYNDSVYYFYDTIHEWQKRGYDVYAMDWAGQGASQRDPDHPDIPSTRPLSYHVRDLDQFINQIVKPHAEKPLILSTHSMGGHIGALYMKEHPDTFDKAILAAPMLDLNTSILPRKVFHDLAHVAGQLGFKNSSLPNWRDFLYRLQTASALPPNDLREDMSLSGKLRETFHQALQPYDLKLPTWGWVDSAYDSIEKVTKKGFFKNIKTDILFVTAGRDELVDNKAILKASKEAPHARVLDLPTSRHGVWESSTNNLAKLWSTIDDFTGNKSTLPAPQRQFTQPRMSVAALTPALVSGG